MQVVDRAPEIWSYDLIRAAKPGRHDRLATFA
jgi:hypothetical protein